MLLSILQYSTGKSYLVIRFLATYYITLPRSGQGVGGNVPGAESVIKQSNSNSCVSC